MAWRRSGQSVKAYLVLRQAFGGPLLLGLEVLVAADLVRTVVVAPTLSNRDQRRGDDPPGFGRRAGVNIDG